MRNMLAFIGAAVVTVAGVGWYLGWFTIHHGPSGDGKKSYNIELNTNKIGEDIHKGSEKLQGALKKSGQKAEKASTVEKPPQPAIDVSP
jgi:hypothetical protein